MRMVRLKSRPTQESVAPFPDKGSFSFSDCLLSHLHHITTHPSAQLNGSNPLVVSLLVFCQPLCFSELPMFLQSQSQTEVSLSFSLSLILSFFLDGGSNELEKRGEVVGGCVEDISRRQGRLSCLECPLKCSGPPARPEASRSHASAARSSFRQHHKTGAPYISQ